MDTNKAPEWIVDTAQGPLRVVLPEAVGASIFTPEGADTPINRVPYQLAAYAERTSASAPWRVKSLYLHRKAGGMLGTQAGRAAAFDAVAEALAALPAEAAAVAEYYAARVALEQATEQHQAAIARLGETAAEQTRARTRLAAAFEALGQPEPKEGMQDAAASR